MDRLNLVLILLWWAGRRVVDPDLFLSESDFSGPEPVFCGVRIRIFIECQLRIFIEVRIRIRSISTRIHISDLKTNLASRIDKVNKWGQSGQPLLDPSNPPLWGEDRGVHGPGLVGTLVRTIQPSVIVVRTGVSTVPAWWEPLLKPSNPP